MGRCCVGCGCVFTSFRLDYVGVWLVWVVCVSVWFAPSGLGWAVGCLVLVLLFVGTFCLVLVLWFGLGGWCWLRFASVGGLFVIWFVFGALVF